MKKFLAALCFALTAHAASSPASAKSKLDIEPVSAEALEKTVAGLFELSPALRAKLKEIFSMK